MYSRIFRRTSLEHHLQWGLGLLITLTLVGLTLLAVWVGREASIGFVASRLAHDSNSIVASLDPQTGQLTRALPAIYSQPFSGHYYIISLGQDRSLRSRSLWDVDLNLPTLSTGEQSTAIVDGPLGQRLLIRQAAYEKQGQTINLAIAEDIAPLLSASRQFIVYALVLAALAVLSLLLTQRLILRRAFLRLDAAREDVRRIRQGMVGELSEEVPDEIRPLVNEFNQLLSTWRGHLERSRTASGNLAHALKSPLNIIYQTGLEKQQPEVCEQSRRMQQIIERELNRARIAGSVSAGRRFSPAGDLADLVNTIRILFREKPLEIETHIEAPEHLPFEQDDMQEMIGNLLDNAAKWARGRILITLEARDEMNLTVQDDGPGIDPGQSDQLTTRGKRLDEQTPGHGLGLSIVQEIAEQYKGRIRFERSSVLGGASITLTLPLES